MKLKFRAEAKDWVAFATVCLFLLVIIAFAVVNLSSLAQTGELKGFAPWIFFEAFLPEYIVATILYFLLGVLALFLSVSSYFFEREKGVGIISAPKKDNGYSRFATDDELKKVTKKINPALDSIDAAGVPIITDKKKGVWVDSGEAHSLIIGATGSGKTQFIVHPLVQFLAKKGESMIITDPKGEIYENSGKMLREKGYKIILLNFRSPQEGNCWNPLTLPYKYMKNDNADKANELLNDLGINILHDEKGDDPFWQNTAADYFTGLALGLFDDAERLEQININSINLMSNIGEERFGNTTYIKEYFEGKDPASPAYINASGTVMAPNDTKNSVLSVLKQKIKVFAVTQNLSEMLSYSDFDMDTIGKEKTAVFMIIQDEKKTYHALATVFIKQCYEVLIDVAQKNGGQLPIRTNFILDEFANMPPIKDITTMITAARSRQIRFNMIIQNFAQLNQVYGKENAETIKGNCGNLIYLLSSELQALEEISKLCGDKIIKVGKDKKEETRPLITISELQRMKMHDAIILKHRQAPFKTKLMGSWEYDFGSKKYDKDTYPLREKKPLQLFDVREFVKKNKEKNLMAMFDNNEPSKKTNPNPFGFGTGMPGNDSFDVDDLIKKIDAKIAELEAEENEGKTDAADNSHSLPKDVLPSNMIDLETFDKKNEVNLDDTMQLDIFKDKKIEEPLQKPIPEINPDIYINESEAEKLMDKKEKENDDDFFDDFFFDE